MMIDRIFDDEPRLPFPTRNVNIWNGTIEEYLIPETAFIQNAVRGLQSHLQDSGKKQVRSCASSIEKTWKRSKKS
jgi:hypothetical protein